MEQQTYFGGPIFDGYRFHHDTAIEVQAGRITALRHQREGETGVDLNGDILCPGFVDLQVNGGGGVMLTTEINSFQTIAEAHLRLGTAALLPTLITDTPDQTAAVIDSAISAARDRSGLLGLHLEGPHLDQRKHGAHDPTLIRPMSDTDLGLYLEAANALPVLKITVAPEAVTLAQVRVLADAGVLVALGHSACDYETAMAYGQAGASVVTHLWNAMSPLTSRAPGLVGAGLSGAFFAGVIADGVHIHPATLRSSWAAQAQEGRLFLVSDAMACAGTDLLEFSLAGRRILRREGRLTLDDGTLAGADLDLLTAVRVLHHICGIALDEALCAATALPADLVGVSDIGRLAVGATAPLLRIRADLADLSVL